MTFEEWYAQYMEEKGQPNNHRQKENMKAAWQAGYEAGVSDIEYEVDNYGMYNKQRAKDQS